LDGAAAASIKLVQNYILTQFNLQTQKNWSRLSSYFQYNKEIRRIMYTTNIIEVFHRQLRTVTKSKGAFQSEDTLMKLLFLVQETIVAKWNKPVHN